jgi:hypothetical protein
MRAEVQPSKSAAESQGSTLPHHQGNLKAVNVAPFPGLWSKAAAVLCDTRLIRSGGRDLAGISAPPWHMQPADLALCWAGPVCASISRLLERSAGKMSQKR